jgi:hypothetical protein
MISNGIDQDLNKKTVFKTMQEQSYSIVKPIKSREYISVEKCKEEVEKNK